MRKSLMFGVALAALAGAAAVASAADNQNSLVARGKYLVNGPATTRATGCSTAT